MISSRIVWSFCNVPTRGDWLQGLCILLVYALVSISFGIWQGFFQRNLVLSKLVVIKVIATSLIAPALLEELFFRAVLLPHPVENTTLRSTLIWSTIGLFLFIVYHPLNGLTFFPQGRLTFFCPVFLTLAALLGLACTVAYLYTGSVWISVIIHWLAVIVWLLCLGGIDRLNFNR